MITVRMLKKLISQLPEDALVSAYEGEDSGLNIYHEEKHWWIRASYEYPHKKSKTHTEGFDYNKWGES